MRLWLLVLLLVALPAPGHVRHERIFDGAHTPFLYNGRYGVQTDPNGLLHMRARYYNPYLCRFLNPDPLGFTGGLNFYAYADGNPISLLDPFGLGSRSADNGSASLLRQQTPVGGYVDPFGNWHPTFCLSCHDNTPEARFHRDQAVLANLLDWRAIAYQQALGAALGIGFGALAEDLTAIQSVRQVRQVQQTLALVKYDPVFALEQGANPSTVVPYSYTVVRGGTTTLPPPGTVFSGSMGETLSEAAAGVPHGTIRVTTAGAVRSQGGSVTLVPEPTRSGVINLNHVDIVEGSVPTTFGPPIPNPVPRPARIR